MLLRAGRTTKAMKKASQVKELQALQFLFAQCQLTEDDQRVAVAIV